MTVRLEGEVIHLSGECRVEDAEPLLTMLQDGPGRAVNLTAAGHLHAAVVQVLVALRPPLAGPPGDAFTARWLVPLFSAQAPG
jgi:hypothetical protein